MTLARAHRAETREKGSRFIATALPAGDEAGARAAIAGVEAEFPDATHHCWARVLQGPGQDPVERAHDAGEPAGTAGPPILQAIRSAGVRDVVVVVTRYFGGTKLGKGGLARAYRAAAARALEGAPKRTSIPMRRVLIRVPLAIDGETRHVVARHGGRVTSSSYEDPDRSELSVVLPSAARARLEEEIQALARGAARLVDEDGDGVRGAGRDAGPGGDI